MTTWGELMDVWDVLLVPEGCQCEPECDAECQGDCGCRACRERGAKDDGR